MRLVRCEGGLCDGMEVSIEDWEGEGAEFFCPPLDASGRPGVKPFVPQEPGSTYRIVGDVAVCIDE